MKYSDMIISPKKVELNNISSTPLYLIHRLKIDEQGNKYLLVNFFKGGELIDLVALYKESYVIRSTSNPKTIRKTLSMAYYFCKSSFIETKQSNDFLYKTIGIKNHHSFASNIDTAIVHIANMKRYEKKSEVLNDISIQMKLFKPVRQKTKAIKNLFNHYMFTDNGIGFCTYCGKSSNVSFKSGKDEKCPYCNTTVKVRSVNIGRNSLEEVHWTVKLEEVNGILLTRYFCHTRNLTNIDEKIYTSEKIRGVYDTNGEFRDYSLEEQYNKEFMWDNYKNHYGVFGSAPREDIRPRSITFIQDIKEINMVISNTFFKYSGLAEFIDSVTNKNREIYNPYIAEKYLYEWKKCNKIELLAKAGWGNLIITGYYYSSTRFINNDGKNTLSEIIGLPLYQLKWFEDKEDRTWQKVDALAYLNKSKIFNSTKENFEEINALGFLYEGSLKTIEELNNDYNVKPFKFMRYFYRQHSNNTGLGGGSQSIHSYKDYLRNAKALGFDTNDNSIQFPKNLKTSHDRMAKVYSDYLDEKKQKEIEEYNKKLAEAKAELKKIIAEALLTGKEVLNPSYLEYDKLCIKPVEQISDLDNESKVLGHCVHSYKERVINGQTQIFFVRKQEDRNMPYFTLEWNNGKIVQLRGKNNCAAPYDVKLIADLFAERMAEYEKAV